MIKAPDFTLEDQEGKKLSLQDYSGRWVIIYTYPKDDTPGCSKEACAFRDSSEELKAIGAVVLGISKDTVKSHTKFANKFHLNFPILSDVTLETIKEFGAWGKKKFMGKEYDGVLRQTFIIDPKRMIAKSYLNVNVATHAQDVLADLKQLMVESQA